MAAATGPVQVFLLAGQSNMVGMGSIEHLQQLIDAPDTPNEFRDNLWDTDTNSFHVRDNVYIKNGDTHGKLTVAQGYAAGDCFGPELMFGWEVADALEDSDSQPTILLIKTAWEGKNLWIDFRSPSSGMPAALPANPNDVGASYRLMIEQVKETLADLSSTIPGYTDDRGYKLQGFCWFHGWTDMLEWSTVDEYGSNLANLISDVRSDLDAPKMVTVIGEMGLHGHGAADLMDPASGWVPRALAFRKQQYDVTQLVEFLGNTVFVTTAEYVVYGKETFNYAFHYNGRAETFFHIGQALGRAMVELLKDSSGKGKCPVPYEPDVKVLPFETS